MKLLVVIISVILLSFNAILALKPVLIPENQKQINHFVGVCLGPNLSDITSSIENDHVEPDFYFTGGFNYLYSFSGTPESNLFLGTGLLYSGRTHDLGSYTKTDETGQVIGQVKESKVIKDYLLVPLYIRYYLNDNFFLNPGVYAASLLSIHYLEDDKLLREDDHNYENLDYGLDLGLGYTYIITRDLRLNLSYSFQYSLVDDYAGNNYTHSLLLGLDFGIFNMRNWKGH